ncbi:MAG: YfhO family protein [Ruminococcus sp.]|nr:YfhO family protein [Ruminococcus sp.]
MENTNEKEYVGLYESGSSSKRNRKSPERFRKSKFHNIIEAISGKSVSAGIKTARLGNRFRKSRFCDIMYGKGVLFFVLSFFIPAFIFAYGFAQHGIQPFDSDGDRQMLVIDLWHQYYPFFRVEREKLLSGGSFLYSWQNGLGSNFLSLIAYYAASPLNWISVFFDSGHVREALSYILVGKIGFAGAFFSCFLRYTFRRRDFSLCVFSSMYALCSYMLGYYWNVMWMDTIALFPLVMMGIVAITREGKWKTFTFALALSLFSNYYIGLFTCIFCVFMFAASGIIEFRGIKDLLCKLVIMIRSSVLGIALAAFILLPAYFGLKLSYSANNTFPEETIENYKWNELFANMISYKNPTALEGLPNFSSGMLAIMLFGVFMLSFGVKIREMGAYSLLLGLIVVSCNINKLDLIWHGLHVPNQIPHRYAFIFSFVFIAMAYRAYDVLLKNGIKVYQLLLMLVGPVLVFLCERMYYVQDGNNTEKEILRFRNIGFGNAEKYAALAALALVLMYMAARLIPMRNRQLKNRISGTMLIASAASVAVCVIICVYKYAIKKEQLDISEAIQKSMIITAAYFMVFLAVKVFPFRKTAVRNFFMTAAIGTAVFSELISNARIGLNTLNPSAFNSYPANGREVQSLLNKAANSEEDLFYRTEIAAPWTLNNGALYGYNGVSQFSSTANVAVTTLYSRLGLYASEAGNRYYYRTSTPVVNSLLGIQYIIDSNGPLNTEEKFLEYYDASGNSYLYKNKYPLSLGFMMDEDILSMEDSAGLNPLEFQNTIVKLAAGIEEPLFNACAVTLVERDGIDVTKNGFGNYTFRVTAKEGTDAKVTYTFAGTEGSVMYSYVSSTGSGIKDVRVSCDDLWVMPNDDGNPKDLIKSYPLVIPMGNSGEGTMSRVQMTVRDDKKSGNYQLKTYTMNLELFEKFYDSLADEQLEITSFSDAKIKGTINAKKDGVMFLSIPYEKGWSVYIDGKKADTFKVLHSMLGVEVSVGNHDIVLKYSPEGFKGGLAVSGAGSVGIGAVIWYDHRKKYRKKRRGKEPEGIIPDEDELTDETDISEASQDIQIYDQFGRTEEIPEFTAETEAEAENEKSESNDSLSGN